MLSKEEIYSHLQSEVFSRQRIAILIFSLKRYDPMLDEGYFVGEAYIKFTDDKNIAKIKNKAVLSRSFYNFVLDTYRREFSTWKKKKVEHINTIFSDHELNFMKELEFDTNDRYMYAYIMSKSTTYRLGLKFLRGKDNKICKFKIIKHLKLLIKKILVNSDCSLNIFTSQEKEFLLYALYKNKNCDINFIKKNGSISKSLEVAYYKKIVKKIFTLLEEDELLEDDDIG